MTEEWNPKKEPAPEFRGVAMTYEQFNQLIEMNKKLVEIQRLSIVSNIAKTLAMISIVLMGAYVLNWIDANNIIARLIG